MILKFYSVARSTWHSDEYERIWLYLFIYMWFRMMLYCPGHCTNKWNLDEAVMWMKVCGHFLSQARGNDESGTTLRRSRTAGCSLTRNAMQQQRQIFISLVTWAIGRNCLLWVSVQLATPGCHLSASSSVIHSPKDMRMFEAHL